MRFVEMHPAEHSRPKTRRPKRDTRYVQLEIRRIPPEPWGFAIAEYPVFVRHGYPTKGRAVSVDRSVAGCTSGGEPDRSNASTDSDA